MEYPQLMMVVNQSTWVINGCERIELVRLSVSVGIDAAHNSPAAFFLTQRTLLVDPYENFACRRSNHAYGITYFRWCRKHVNIETLRRFDVSNRGSGAACSLLEFGQFLFVCFHFQMLPQPPALDPKNVVRR